MGEVTEWSTIVTPDNDLYSRNDGDISARGSFMITDPLFYRLFETSPETFFLLLGMSSESAAAMAACYQFEAVEFKQTRIAPTASFGPLSPTCRSISSKCSSIGCRVPMRTCSLRRLPT